MTVAKSKTNAPTFAARLRALREAAALSQSELARRAGITRQGYGQIEAGASEPGWTTVCRIADVLGVGLEELRA